jgi:starvation-inducible DNA-binding protein
MATEDNLYEELQMIQDKIQGNKRTTGANPLVAALGVLLANTFTIYHETHGIHWNVKGPDFAQYHELFSNIYEDFFDAVDPTAELILKLGYDAPFHMSRFAQMKTIEEFDISEGDSPQEMSTELLKAVNEHIAELKEVFTIANDMNEQGIANFIAERIDSSQKWAWQLRASLGIQKANRF